MRFVQNLARTAAIVVTSTAVVIGSSTASYAEPAAPTAELVSQVGSGMTSEDERNFAIAIRFVDESASPRTFDSASAVAAGADAA